MPKDSRAETFLEWERILDTVDSQMGDKASAVLRERVEQLRAAMIRSKELGQRQAQLEAERRQVTRDLRETLNEGRSLAGLVRLGTQAEFGTESVPRKLMRQRSRTREP